MPTRKTNDKNIDVITEVMGLNENDLDSLLIDLGYDIKLLNKDLEIMETQFSPQQKQVAANIVSFPKQKVASNFEPLKLAAKTTAKARNAEIYASAYKGVYDHHIFTFWRLSDGSSKILIHKDDIARKASVIMIGHYKLRLSQYLNSDYYLITACQPSLLKKLSRPIRDRQCVDISFIKD